MSPVAEIRLVMARELRRSFRSSKGVLLVLIAVLGGAGVSTLFAWMDRMKREALASASNGLGGLDLSDAVASAQEPLFEHLYGPATAKALAPAPYSLWMMLMATLWLGPLLISLLDYDAVSGEVQHRSVRFWTVRARRSSYITGKALGAWITVLAVTLGMNVIVWAVVAGIGQIPVGQVLAWGPRFFAVTIPISAAWCGVAMLVGSLFRTPMMSLLAISAAFSGLWIASVAAGLSERPWLAYLYPNTYDALLLSPDAGELALGALGPVAIAAVTTAAAALLFEMRDV
jgi:ABC-type transport system involved in multi-copper enzyme maturation permease subunit